MSTRTKKRRVERIFNRVSFLPAGTQSDITLHAAEDSKTLVRILVDLCVYANDPAAQTTGELLIHHAPAGTGVRAPSVTGVNDTNVPVVEIARIPIVSIARQDATGQTVFWERLYRDIKAMRKIRESDSIMLSHIAGTANDIQVYGIIYLWFKE